VNIIIRKYNGQLTAFYMGEDFPRRYIGNQKTTSCSKQTYKESSRLTEQDYASEDYKKFVSELQTKFGVITFKQTWEQLDA